MITYFLLALAIFAGIGLVIAAIIALLFLYVIGAGINDKWDK